MKERVSEEASVEAQPPIIRTRRGVGRRSGPGSTAFPLLVLNDLVRSASSALTFLGLTLGVFISRKFLILPIAVLAAAAQERLKGEGHGHRPLRAGRR